MQHRTRVVRFGPRLTDKNVRQEPGSAAFLSGNRFDFDQHSRHRKSRNLNERKCGSRIAEILDPDGINLGAVLDIGQVDRDLPFRISADSIRSPQLSVSKIGGRGQHQPSTLPETD